MNSVSISRIAYQTLTQKSIFVFIHVFIYQQKDGEEPIKDVISVREVTPPTKGNHLQYHLYYIVDDKSPIDDL